MEDESKQLGGGVINITPPPTREQLEQSIDYWRKLACEQQALAHRRRPISEKTRDVIGFVMHSAYFFYQSTFKGRSGPFS